MAKKPKICVTTAAEIRIRIERWKQELDGDSQQEERKKEKGARSALINFYFLFLFLFNLPCVLVLHSNGSKPSEPASAFCHDSALHTPALHKKLSSKPTNSHIRTDGRPKAGGPEKKRKDGDIYNIYIYIPVSSLLFCFFTSGRLPPRSCRGDRWSWCAARGRARPRSDGYHGGSCVMKKQDTHARREQREKRRTGR